MKPVIVRGWGGGGGHSHSLELTGRDALTINC